MFLKKKIPLAHCVRGGMVRTSIFSPLFPICNAPFHQ